jgi:NAD(P)-dependent dehydrogenase (short-subunit alcohol dehydrogenase family)
MTYSIDFSGKSVLITGGTKGIGLAGGLAFARGGAQVFLTHKWGSADNNEIRKQFAETGGPEPVIVQADVAEKDDTKRLMATIQERSGKLDIFISNVSFADLPESLQHYKLKSFTRSVEYSAWPLVSHLQLAHKTFGAYPKYTVAISSSGPDGFYPRYDYVATTKAMLENLARYLSAQLLPDGCRVNVLRAGIVLTESFQATFGEAFYEFLKDKGGEFHIPADEVAKSLVAMCSGLMDGLNGQTVTVDYGAQLRDNIVNLIKSGVVVPAPKSDG